MLTDKEILRDRIEAKKHELMSRMASLKGDARAGATLARRHAKRKLDELEQVMGEGWDRLTDRVAARLNMWLEDKDERAPTEPTHRDL